MYFEEFSLFVEITTSFAIFILFHFFAILIIQLYKDLSHYLSSEIKMKQTLREGLTKCNFQIKRVYFKINRFSILTTILKMFCVHNIFSTVILVIPS